MAARKAATIGRSCRRGQEQRQMAKDAGACGCDGCPDVSRVQLGLRSQRPEPCGQRLKTGFEGKVADAAAGDDQLASVAVDMG